MILTGRHEDFDIVRVAGDRHRSELSTGDYGVEKAKSAVGTMV